MHVVRNAVDHGIETGEERVAAGKPLEPTLALKAYTSGDALVIEVADDGRGIDWNVIARKASDAGLPAHSPGDLADALFADGVSSRDVVSELSGRGVGLAAVKQACEDLGGKVEVLSRKGRGTQFLFRLPLSRVDAGVLGQAA